MMDAQRFGANLFLAIGLSALGFGAVVLRDDVAFHRRARHTQGTVLQVNEGRSENGEAFYVAIVRWTPPDGVPRTFNTYPQRWGDPSAGDRLDLLYDPVHPDAAPHSTDVAGRVFFFGAMATLGVAFASIGVKVRVRMWREARRAQTF